MFFEEEKFGQRARELESRRWAGMQSIDWFYTREGELSCGEVYTNCPDPFAGDKICLGEEFVGRDRYLWLEREIHVPEEKDGCKVMGYFNFGKTGGGGNSGFEALLYINGQPCQGVDTNHPFCGTDDPDDLPALVGPGRRRPHPSAVPPHCGGGNRIPGRKTGCPLLSGIRCCGESGLSCIRQSGTDRTGKRVGSDPFLSGLGCGQASGNRGAGA